MQILLNVTLLLLPRVLVLILTAVAIIAMEVQDTMTILIQASGGQTFHGDNPKAMTIVLAIRSETVSIIWLLPIIIAT